MKECSRCHKNKPISEYRQRNGKPINQCKECELAYGREYRQKNRKLLSARTARRTRIRTAMLRMYKGGVCADCGDSRLWLLCFHHRDPSTKSYEINSRSMSYHQWEEHIAEADKCDLLCPTCHQERHTVEGNRVIAQAVREEYNHRVETYGKQTALCMLKDGNDWDTWRDTGKETSK